MPSFLRVLPLLALILLAACSTPREAPSCSGPTFTLNEGRWQPADEDADR